MVIPDLIKDFYEETESQGLQDILYLQTDIGAMAKIREENPDDWEIAELTQAIMFDEVQIIESLKGEIERARAAGKRLKKLSG